MDGWTVGGVLAVDVGVGVSRERLVYLAFRLCVGHFLTDHHFWVIFSSSMTLCLYRVDFSPTHLHVDEVEAATKPPFENSPTVLGGFVSIDE